MQTRYHCYNTCGITWSRHDANTYVGTCDASDIQWKGMHNKKCIFMSHVTGVKLLFELIDTDKDQEDIRSWRLRSEDKGNLFFIIIFND